MPGIARFQPKKPHGSHNHAPSRNGVTILAKTLLICNSTAWRRRAPRLPSNGSISASTCRRTDFSCCTTFTLSKMLRSIMSATESDVKPSGHDIADTIHKHRTWHRSWNQCQYCASGNSLSECIILTAN